MTRVEAFRGKGHLRNGRTHFVVTHHPGLPNINKLLRDLHPVLESSERCKRAIGQVPMVAFRKPKSLADYLVRAKVSKGCRENIQRGTSRCGSRRCVVCDYIDESDHFLSSHTGRRYSSNYSLNCNSSNVVYLLTCRNCTLQYVGSTVTKFRLRSNNHKARMKRHGRLNGTEQEKDDFLYKHFCGDGHEWLEGCQDSIDRSREWTGRTEGQRRPMGL